MLAYELFLSNKNSTKNNPKKQFPIKKIFYKNNDAVIDSKTCEQYGSEFTRDTEQLQNWLQMPLNTIDVKELNLPDFRTGTNSANQNDKSIITRIETFFIILKKIPNIIKMINPS